MVEITRRRLLGSAGAAVAASRIVVPRLASQEKPRVITSRVLTNVGSEPIPAGTAFRFGLPFKQGDVPAETPVAGFGPTLAGLHIGRGEVPSGTSVFLQDSLNTVVPAQFDALSYWPDGSLRFCEVLGYTARTINSNSTETIRVTTSPSGFANTLPGGKTAAQLLTDLQSFVGAQDLLIECASMASCSGASNVYTSGTWTSHFNALAVGSFVQQINKGQCCMGFSAWGGLSDGTRLHAHIHTRFYVWLWLNPSTGVIQDVEFLVYLHNSLLTQNIDGSAQYSSFPPDRYNYTPTLRNGATTIQAFTIHSGTSGTVGGHSTRAGWFTARADGKARWINGTIEAATLLVTCDPIQANPQSVITARSYLLGSGVLPKWDVGGVNANNPPTGVATPISYAPMVKGLWPDEDFSDWNSQVGIDAGGDHQMIGLLPQWTARDLCLQTTTTARNNRISTLGWASLFGMLLDTNGRIPNFRSTSYQGLGAAKPLVFFTGDAPIDYAFGVTKSTESTINASFCYGNWGFQPETTHYPSGAYYTYLMEGGAHNRDIINMAATIAVEQASASQDMYPGGVYPVGAGAGYICRTPILGSGVRYYCNTMVAQSCRQQAWGLREISLAGVLLPATLADGTTYGEAGYWRDNIRDNVLFMKEYIDTVLSPNERNNGFWHFDGDSGTGPIKTSWTGTDDPFQNSYLAEAIGATATIHGTDPVFGAAAMACADFHSRYFAGILTGMGCSILSSAQSINIKEGFLQSSPFKASWSLVGAQMTQVDASGGDVWMLADFLDASTGLITLRSAHGGNSWPEVPFDVGATIFFTRDYFSIGGWPAPPAPFVPETGIYYVVFADTVNFRIRVSATPGGSPILYSSTVSGSSFCVTKTSDCAATFHPVISPGNTYAYMGYQSANANMSLLNLATRTYRRLLGGTGLANADAISTARLASSGIGSAGYGPFPADKVLI